MTIMPVYCNICEKIFTTRCHLNRHLRNVHHVTPKPTSYDKSVHSFKCLEESCNNSFRYNSDLIKHLKNDHSFNIEDPEIKIFVNEEDFKNWKLKIETTEKCNYVIIRGIQRLSCGDVKTYYVCNRSGFYHKKYKQKATKYHGTCKINSSCISQMNVTMLANGTIKVERQKMHYGHSISIQHLRISKEDRNIIANKLIQGESKKSILESFRNKIGTDIKRSDLITLKDIENVQRDFKLSIEKGIKHEEDAINIDLWVTENMQCKENPVIYYKPQGENMDPLEIDDFCLIIMNQYQQLMLKTFGQNTIVVDSTHGLTQYDFEMTTIMVIDDCGEGFPVTYMFTNRKDTVVHTLLFDVIRTRIGILKTKTFMSHMSEVFYEAWTYSMGKTEHQLYCSWHVDRAWQMNLSKIANKKKRALVNKTLKAVQQNVDSNSFEDQFDSMLEDLLIDPDTKAFGIYLETNYSKNYEKWAYCYRKNCGINADMVLESIHETVKYFYFNRKMVKRLDKGLRAVLQYTRDKTVDRLKKQIKGKHTGCKKNIMKQHRVAVSKSLEMDALDNGRNKWELIDENISYYIQKVSEKCCQLDCDFCNICIHMYTCSCSDFVMRGMICKHIHSLCIKFKELAEEQIKSEDCSNDEQVDNDNQTCLPQSSREVTDRSDIKEKLHNELCVLSAKIAMSEVDVLNEEVFEEQIKSEDCSNNEQVDNDNQTCLPQSSREVTDKNDIKEKLHNELCVLSAKIAMSEVDVLNEEVLTQVLSHLRNANNLLDLKMLEIDR